MKKDELLKGTPYEGASKGDWRACHIKNSKYGVVGFDITTQPESSVSPLCRYEWGRGKSDAKELEANSYLFRDAKLNAARVQLLTKALCDLKTAVTFKGETSWFNGVEGFEARVTVEFVQKVDAALKEAGMSIAV